MEKVKREITIRSFAKINLSLDVKGQESSGYHIVDMIMHQLAFHDDVRTSIEEKNPVNSDMISHSRVADDLNLGNFTISLSTNKYYLPTDSRNLAYKAAQLMINRFGQGRSGNLNIEITKRIPVAAGLAGGSGNAAAVIHSINVLWKLNLPLKELCSLGEKLGSDVPFCIIGQIKGNKNLPDYLKKDILATTCARAEGTGTELLPLKSLNLPIVIAKPNLSVSTAEVYRGIDSCKIQDRPDNDRLCTLLMESGIVDFCGNKDKNTFSNIEEHKKEFVNVLENYTLNAYPKVKLLKSAMQEFPHALCVLMSGSGPTVLAVTKTMEDAINMSENLREEGYESYWTRTLT